ncbi:MAG: hypothetical protein ACR650_03950 [Methylocystis sp.]
MEYELKDVSFLQAPVASLVAKHVNKLGKGRNKRKNTKLGARTMVGARLTADQITKLEGLVGYYTKLTGVQATVSSVIAELIDTAKCSVITSELS